MRTLKNPVFFLPVLGYLAIAVAIMLPSNGFLIPLALSLSVVGVTITHYLFVKRLQLERKSAPLMDEEPSATPPVERW